MTQLEAKNLTLTYDSKKVAEALSVSIEPRRITALIGPNGSGKSTFLKALSRILAPTKGAVLLDGKSLWDWGPKTVARLISHLPQNPEVPSGLTVRDLVQHGRHPWGRGLGGLSQQDIGAIGKALDLADMTELADRPVGALSGGQRQRAWIAMALAQDANILLFDEPTSFLDLSYQLELMQLIVKLNREDDRTIVVVLHDLNQAARIAHRIVALKDGEIVADGSPVQVVTPENLRSIFNIQADVISDPRTGTPYCIPWACV